MSLDNILQVSKRLWSESFFTKEIATEVYPKLRYHRMHFDVPFYTKLDHESNIYRYFFTNKDYKWLLDFAPSIFNMLLVYKKDSQPMNWTLLHKILQIVKLEQSGSLTEEQAHTLVADTIEEVHPSGIKEILNKQ